MDNCARAFLQESHPFKEAAANLHPNLITSDEAIEILFLEENFNTDEFNDVITERTRSMYNFYTNSARPAIENLLEDQHRFYNTLITSTGPGTENHTLLDNSKFLHLRQFEDS